MTETQSESTSAPVPARTKRAKQAEEGRVDLSGWTWAEPSVWTKRMLVTLDRGVKGGQWFSLIDKVYADRTLRAAFEQVRSNRGSAGVDHQTIKMVERQLDRTIEWISNGLARGSYEPQPIRRVHIPKPGKRETRPLGIPTVRDRIVQTALRWTIEPIFEQNFAEHSYGFRPERGCHDAVARVRKLLSEGHHWVVDADLKGYFDTIPHERLLELVAKKISDGRVLDLIQKYLKQEVMDGLSTWHPADDGGRGTPQGAVISPLLSNIYLDPLDHVLAGKGWEMVRYADDFVVLCRTQEEAEQTLRAIECWVVEAGLELHPDKTRIVDERVAGFDFLGFHFNRDRHWPSDRNRQQLRDKLRPKTQRSQGRSLEDIIKDVNRTLRGWHVYFATCSPATVASVDKWVRRRLRTILSTRHKRKGQGRGLDHFRWPNRYFAARGLFNVEAACRISHQSARRR